MPLEIGDCSDGTGLAGAIGEASAAAIDGFDIEAPASYNFANALATAIVEYLVANAEISVADGTAGGDTLVGTLT